MSSADRSKHPGGKKALDQICQEIDITSGELQELARGSSVMTAVYRTCQKARNAVVGTWETGIKELESLKERIEVHNDGTTLHIIKEKEIYRASLLICGAAMKAMNLENSPKVFSADFTYAKSLHGAHGQWWALSCPDAEGHIVPLAIGHCVENENKVIN